MGDDRAGITPEEFATWLTPSEALSSLQDCLERTEASHAIWDRLKGGIIRAAAEKSSKTVEKGNPNLTDRPSLILPVDWQYFTRSKEAQFWKVGDARFFFGRNSRWGQQVTILRYGIRLDPVAVGTLVAAMPSKPRPVAPVAAGAENSDPRDPAETEEAQADKGPPVSDEHLRAWHDLYRRAYSGSVDTEEMALSSARGMFPGKSVSRERVRALRGRQRRGRKSTDQQG